MLLGCNFDRDAKRLFGLSGIRCGPTEQALSIVGLEGGVGGSDMNSLDWTKLMSRFVVRVLIH
jgi:hypothetical protein